MRGSGFVSDDAAHGNNIGSKYVGESKVETVFKRCAVVIVFVLGVFFILWSNDSAYAATSAPAISRQIVEQKLENLKKLAKDGVYFTYNGKACTDQWVEGHGESGTCATSNCSYTKVIKSSSAFRKNSGLALWPENDNAYPCSSKTEGSPAAIYGSGTATCIAFAKYAGWYLAASRNSDIVYFYRLIDCSLADIHKYAKAGDIITHPTHAMIYLGCDDQGIEVLDCNNRAGSKGNSLIQKRKYKYNDKKQAVKKFTIARAVNIIDSGTPYFEVDFREANGHTYKLFNGYASWEEAQRYVESLGKGWHLMTINSEEEQIIAKELTEKWTGYRFGGNAWIGAKYTSGAWSWTTGEPFTMDYFMEKKEQEGLYACIYGLTAEKGKRTNNPAFKTKKGMWGALSSPIMSLQSGFLAEYSPELASSEEEFLYYAREIYLTGTEEVESFRSADPESEEFCCYLANIEIAITAAYRGTNGKLWFKAENGGYIPAEKLTFVRDDCKIICMPDAGGIGSIINSPSQNLSFIISSSNSLLGFDATIKEKETGKIVRNATYIESNFSLTGLSSEDTEIMSELCPNTLPHGEYVLTVTPKTGKKTIYGQTEIYAQNPYEIEFSIENQHNPVKYRVMYSKGLRIRSEPAKTSTSIKTMPYQTCFWVYPETFSHNSDDGYTWARAYIEDGTEGWVAVSNANFCVPVDADIGTLDISSIVELKVVLSDVLSVFEETSILSQLLRTLDAGDIVRAWVDTETDIDNTTWVQAYLDDGTIGWIDAAAMQACAIEMEYVWDQAVEMYFVESSQREFEVGSVAHTHCLDAEVPWFEWESSDLSVITVMPYGVQNEYCMITAIGKGEATISISGKYEKTFVVNEPEDIVVEDFVITRNYSTDDEDDYAIVAYTGNEEHVVFPSKLEKYEITGVRSSGLFDNTSIQSITFEEGIQGIYSHAFEYALLGVKDIYFPSTLMLIQSDAFVFDGNVFVTCHFAQADYELSDSFIYNEGFESEMYGTAYKIIIDAPSDSRAYTYACERGWERYSESDFEGYHDSKMGSFYFSDVHNPEHFAPNSYLANRMTQVLREFPVGSWFTEDGLPYNGENDLIHSPVTGSEYADSRLWDLRYAYVVFHRLFGYNLSNTGSNLLTKYTQYDDSGNITADSLYGFFNHVSVRYGAHFRNNNVVSLIVLSYDENGIWALNCDTSGAANGERRIGVVCSSWDELASVIDASANIYIEQPNSFIQLNETSLTLELAQEIQLSAELTSYENRDAVLTWKSDDCFTAVVDEGKVSISNVKSGRTRITVQSKFGAECICEIEVNRPRVVLEKEEVTLLIGAFEYGKQIVIDGYIEPLEADQTVSMWYSKDESIVKVENGTLTAVSEGETYIGLIHPTLVKSECLVHVKKVEEPFCVPYGVTELKERCFSELRTPNLIILPSTVAKIGDSIFDGCTQPLFIYVPSSAEEINGDAFSGAAEIYVYTERGSKAEEVCNYAGITCIYVK